MQYKYFIIIYNIFTYVCFILKISWFFPQEVLYSIFRLPLCASLKKYVLIDDKVYNKFFRLCHIYWDILTDLNENNWHFVFSPFSVKLCIFE